MGTVATLKATVTGTVTISKGTVAFFADGSQFASAPVSDGVATLTAATAGLPVGTYSVQANYSGTATAVPSSSATVSVKLTAAASTTTLSASPASVTPPADVTLTATVASADGTPTGSVTFYDGTLSLGAVDLSAGKASFTASTKGLAAGSYSVHAAYSGSANISSSVSSNVSVTVK